MQNRLVLTYVITFIIIAGVVIFNKLKIQNDSLENFKNDPQIITTATKQATLTQQMAKSTLAISYATNQSSFDRIKGELSEQFQEWNQNHEALQTQGSGVYLNPDNDAQISAMFDQMDNNQNLIGRSIQDVINLNFSDDQDLKDRTIRGAINGVLSRERNYNRVLDDVIESYQQKAVSRIDQFSFYQYFWIAIIIGLMAIEGLFAFRPAVIQTGKNFLTANKAFQKIKKSEEALRKSAKKLMIINKNLQVRTKQLEVAKTKAEAASVAKSQFLANMSHEIRSPLNAIVGFSQILLKEASDIGLRASFTKNLNNIKISGSNLSEIINNVLDISKIEAGKMELAPEILKLEPIFKSIYHINKSRAQEKDLHFTYEFDSRLPNYIETDRTKLNQILMNLVSNAVKFTDRNGSVYMGVTKEAGNIRFEVKDEGIGIPQEKVDTIFNPFEQGDSTTTKRFGGTGLGLAIAKQMVELMGGKIWVESEYGKGSSFYFTIPLVEAVTEIEEVEEQDLWDIHFSKDNVVLVAEDNKMNQELMKDLFAQLHLEFHLAENGEEAVNKSMEIKPNIILMDMHMPKMDGLEATKRIREIDEFKDLPIVAVSADGLIEQQRRALDAGINEYVTKPVDFNKLLPILAKHLKKDEVEKKAAPAQEALQLYDLDLETQEKILGVVNKLKDTSIVNFKAIIDELNVVRKIFEDEGKSVVKIDQIEDVVYDADEDKYMEILSDIEDQLRPVVS
ncbi:MAG: ATP-binding protein [Cyclobacteriaceae bacterium]